MWWQITNPCSRTASPTCCMLTLCLKDLQISWSPTIWPLSNISNLIKGVHLPLLGITFAVTGLFHHNYRSMCHHLKLKHRWCTGMSSNMLQDGHRPSILYIIWYTDMLLHAHTTPRSKFASSFRVLQFYFPSAYVGHISY